MWALCSNVCSCSKSEESVKVDSSPASRSVIGADGASKGAPAPKKGKRLTVMDRGAEDKASADEDKKEEAAPSASEELALPVLTEGADLPAQASLPKPKELTKEVQKPNQIFNLAQHEFCCFGSTTAIRGTQAAIEQEYEEKKLEISGAKNAGELRTALQKLGIAIHCKKGKKPEQPNQDNVLFWKTGDITICGVADGHGPDGHWASHWTARFLLRLLIAEVSVSKKAPGDEAINRIFDLAHQALMIRAADDRFDLNMSGTTLSICIIDHAKKEVVAAWVGDSRCAVVRPGGVQGQSLTADHKPQDKEERTRIRASGGEVVAPGEHDVPHRVFVKGGEVPGLAMSRAMGDCIAHSVGVIHTPGIVRNKLEDHCVLCCSDGVWEFIESSEAGQMVSKAGRDKVNDSSDALCLESRNRWIKEEEYITDDISAIAVWL